MLTQKERTINEICQNGKLEDYRQIIVSLITKIENHNSTISCCYNQLISSCEQSLSDDKKHIRISLINKEKPIHIIWDILHEFGHLVSGIKRDGEYSINREIIAWNIAKEIISEFPELRNEIKDFEIYAKQCLKSYK